MCVSGGGGEWWLIKKISWRILIPLTSVLLHLCLWQRRAISMMQMLPSGPVPFLNRQKIQEFLFCDKWCDFEIFSTNSVQAFFAVAAVAVVLEMKSKILMLITNVSWSKTKQKKSHFTSKYVIYFRRKYQNVTLPFFVNWKGRLLVASLIWVCNGTTQDTEGGGTLTL